MLKQRGLFLTVVIVALSASLPGLSSEVQDRLIVPLNKGENFDQKAQPSGRFILNPTGYSARKRDKRSTRGQTLYSNLNCAQCHSIEGVGGEVGPPLDGIGAHRGRQWLTARVLQPEKQTRDFPELFGDSPSLMPHRVEKLKDAELLSDFLLTLEEPRQGFSIARHQTSDDTSDTENLQMKSSTEAAESEAIKSGRELFSTLHCAACHSLDGSHDRFGPDLEGIKTRLTEKKLEKILAGAVRSEVMKEQAHKLGEEQIYDLKSFLLSLPANPKSGR